VAKVVISYSLTLPQKLYPHLDYLFSINRKLVKNWIAWLWNAQTLESLKEEGKVLSILKRSVKRTHEWIPSRVYRNSLELTGQILRSQIERKEIYDFVANHPCSAFWSEYTLAKELEKTPEFVLNVQKQVGKQIRKGKLERDYLKAVKPQFRGSVFITSADDSLSGGKFKKLTFFKRANRWFISLKIKIPVRGLKFRWFEVVKPVPKKIAYMLEVGAKPKAPLIKRERLKSGFDIYRLILPFEVETEVSKGKPKRVFALDLSPSTNRLAVGTVVERNGHSKPVFFKAKRMIRKLERLLKEISDLERKIDNIADAMHSTSSKRHRRELEERLEHLYQEQKRKQEKFKNLRKEILEIFTDWVVEYAKAYGCEGVAIERLGFKDLPSWRGGKLRRRFATWFYSRVKEKLEYKAKLRGIRLIEVNPAYTSRYCHRCGKEGRADRLSFKCCCGIYDRDYNASVNIGKRALGIRAGKSKSERQSLKDIPARFPFRRGLASFRHLISVFPLSVLHAYTQVVETSSISRKNLSNWKGLYDYG